MVHVLELENTCIHGQKYEPKNLYLSWYHYVGIRLNTRVFSIMLVSPGF